MQLSGKQSIRCAYLEEQGGAMIMGISEDFKDIELASLPTEPQNNHISAINVNNVFNFDLTGGKISIDELVQSFEVNDKNKAPYRLYLYKDGEQLVISYIFISRIRRAVRVGQKSKYFIAGLSETGDVVPLFSIPAEQTNNADLSIINFEIERLLRQENITILDEEDVKFLFQLAVDYVQDLKQTVI